jgi:3'(2'), 5'-bisphosphate nucleotidase
MCEAAEAAHGNRGVTAALATSLGFGDKFVRLDGQCKYCLVGAGAADGNIRLPPLGYLEKIWDHAAGSHFVREAGGRVTDLQDNELDFSLGRYLPEGVRGVLSSNGILHRKFLDGIKATYEEGLKSGQIKRKYLDP